MSGFYVPPDEAGVVEAVRAAVAERAPLAVEGHGTKRASLRPVQAARGLSTRGLTGITLYRPAEMVLSARAGTPIPEIEAALAEHGQMLIGEPPDVSRLMGGTAPATLGGIVATNLTGPRRIFASGATRDHVLGVRAVTGHAEVIRSGGRVHKDVTGLDLRKLLAGSHGTLGILTEITLKVLPRAEAAVTLAISVESLGRGVAVLAAGLGSPFGVTGAALLPEGDAARGLSGPTALLRLEDFSEFLPHRGSALRGLLGGFGPLRLLEGEASATLWQEVRDAGPLGPVAEHEAVWRLSVRPRAGAAVAEALRAAFGARLLLDWGGGLIWAAGPATEAAHAAVMRAAAGAGGTFMLFRAPDALRASVAVLPEEPAPLAAIAARVKAAMDPAGVLNPGRMRAGG
ncbi:FAD-binding protein [Roseomonas marmotae]|uniref:FAD-binding protein n=1 Tax=Roseomonas marmotae TaxID=2768161 RepID=A0ABS3K6U5_9PROT|nr:FAD-binding protein [Roseomonas marmotae]MBO1073155.1 FAD-binding protein [Roseomonas marmotae]QTI79209.1 FAD-binding protein [Roseomonas marmotae]